MSNNHSGAQYFSGGELTYADREQLRQELQAAKDRRAARRQRAGRMAAAVAALAASVAAAGHVVAAGVPAAHSGGPVAALVVSWAHGGQPAGAYLQGGALVDSSGQELAPAPVTPALCAMLAAAVQAGTVSGDTLEGCPQAAAPGTRTGGPVPAGVPVPVPSTGGGLELGQRFGGPLP